MNHIPVLKNEAIDCLGPQANQNFIDATIGSGGHSFGLIEKIKPSGKVLGIDIDQKSIEYLELKFEREIAQKRLILVCDNFANLERIVKTNNFFPVDGILADLGLSSMHLKERGLGFSFLKDEPLIMRFDGRQDDDYLTARKIVNQWPAADLQKILSEYGEEKFAEKIARKIIERRKIRPITKTFELVEIIKSATPSWYHRGRLHPATKTFQALRIAANSELENLEKFLSQAVEILISGGRLAIISFHSLEDRIVKRFFQEKNRQKLIKILTPKPIRPSGAEVSGNPRSRSAKLRTVSKF